MPNEKPLPVGRTVVSPVKCPIPGCRNLKLRANLVCLNHAVDIWQHVDSVRGTSVVDDAIAESAAERERRLDALEAERAVRRQEQGWIYYLRLDDKIKIGWTTSTVQRLRSYPPHAVMLLEHPGTRADERDLHRSFKPSRAAGREWYHPTQEVLAHIERSRTAEMERRQVEHQAKVDEAEAERAEVRAAAVRWR